MISTSLEHLHNFEVNVFRRNNHTVKFMSYFPVKRNYYVFKATDNLSSLKTLLLSVLALHSSRCVCVSLNV
jgi:hypothetical protein